jgi:hypothetical protein
LEDAGESPKTLAVRLHATPVQVILIQDVFVDMPKE